MFYSQIIAAPDPSPFNKPRFISWPSVCNTTRTSWLAPDESDPSTPSAALQNHVEYAGLFEPRSDRQIDHGVLAASSSIYCIAPSTNPCFTFTATPTPLASDFDITIFCAPGVALPDVLQRRSAPEDSLKKPQNPKKRGRPVLFDEIKRAEFLGMVKSGCTVSYAARRIGISNAAVYQARDRDPLFAARLDRAQQERDILSIRRSQNAGEKSWRAAAWLLERNEPKEFSLQHKNRDHFTVRGQRHLKKLIAEVVDGRLANRQAANNLHPAANLALQLIEDRLSEIESESGPYDDSDD